ncbi:tyrosine-protein phosphatase [Brevibacterium sp.]|uniref:tyrosine-protein phosphatase n=1 Tax=Brevibacterium sp. TaxID=1701 RepID=UPI0025BE3CF1|nr:tyrosine-protein phosphatase [Brevibacterium sp.]
MAADDAATSTQDWEAAGARDASGADAVGTAGASGTSAAVPVIPTLPNLRDLGGHRTTDGRRVRAGILYRSVDLSRVDADGLDVLQGLGIRTVFDLRTAPECEQRPDRLPAGAHRVALDVLRDSQQTAPAQMATFFEDAVKAEEFLGGGRAVEHLAQAYRDIVSLPSALEAYSGYFRGLLAADGSASLVHCTTGKDRTGWAAASLLLTLGVEPDAVMADYLRTNTDLLPALQPVFDQFAEAGGSPEMLRPVLGVREEYLVTALAEADARFGGIEGYVREGLGLSEDELTRLRSLFLEG